MNILMLYAGGTVGMKNSRSGLVPDTDFMPRLRAALPPDLCDFADRTCQPVIDSASASPRHWQQLADIISARQDNYDAFVILHGTDTLAYTAAALTEMLQGLGKAVVITGAQVPLGEPDSDALNNIKGALAFARLPALQQTAVFFHDRLLKGNAVRKTDAQSYAAFDSPNVDWLGILSHGEALLTTNACADEEKSAYLCGRWQGFKPQSVATILITPGMPEAAFFPVLTSPEIDAAVILSYGVGNLPAYPRLHTAIKQALARGVCLVNVSQCLSGEISGHTYSVGAARLGLLSGGKSTPEAAYTRLHCLLAEQTNQPLAQRWLNRLKQ